MQEPCLCHSRQCWWRPTESKDYVLKYLPRVFVFAYNDHKKSDANKTFSDELKTTTKRSSLCVGSCGCANDSSWSRPSVVKRSHVTHTPHLWHRATAIPYARCRCWGLIILTSRKNDVATHPVTDGPNLLYKAHTYKAHNIKAHIWSQLGNTWQASFHVNFSCGDPSKFLLFDL